MSETEETELIGGKNPVVEALRSGRELNKIWIAEGLNKQSIGEITTLAKQAGVVVQAVPKKKLDQLLDVNHQGIVASVAAYTYAELDDIFEVAKQRGEDPFILLLDELEDPHNLGSILRTADAVGVHGVIIPKRRSVGLTGVVAKASTGAIEHVPVVRVVNLGQTVDELKKKGVWVAGTDAKGSADYRTMDATLPLAVIIGSEGKGMSRLLKEKCDFLYHLPMRGHVTSLNASVAASLLMYEVLRKRLQRNEKDILLVDGYNIIGAWPELRELKRVKLAEARDRLIDQLAEYQAFKGWRVIVVFDAYLVPGIENKERRSNVEVVFTRENETADERIEKLVSELSKRTVQLHVATSDLTEQWIIFGQGALRISAREFEIEMKEIDKIISEKVKAIQENQDFSKIQLSQEVAEVFEKWRRGNK